MAKKIALQKKKWLQGNYLSLYTYILTLYSKHLLLPEAIQQPFTPIAGKPGLPPPPIIIQKEPSSLTSSTASLKESKEIPITTTTSPPPTTTIVPIVQPIPTPINLSTTFPAKIFFSFFFQPSQPTK